MANYVSAPLVFRLRKAARYLRLYGVARTFVKIQGQYHAARTGPSLERTWWNSKCAGPNSGRRAVAIIGCGNFAYSCIGYYLASWRKDFLRGVFDVDGERAKHLCASYGGAYAAGTFEEILEDKQVRLVFIASNHASHAEYAAMLIRAGKHVHIEKPHVVSEQQLAILESVVRQNPDVRLFLGFNRPRSAHFDFARRHLEEQSGPLMINWFVAGHEISEDHWYFSPAEGGRVLGNLCHWIDASLALVGMQHAFPVVVVPGSRPDSKSDFAVIMQFAEGSVASITFSAKGHTFEGVREVAQIHRGDALLRLSDFHETVIEVGHMRYSKRSLHREHGHSENILHSARILECDNALGEPMEYVSATARLFLGVKNALESGEPVTVD